MNLLPRPREWKRGSGFYQLPQRPRLHFDASLPPKVARTILRRLEIRSVGVRAGTRTSVAGSRWAPGRNSADVHAIRSGSAPDHPEGYALAIDHQGVCIEYRQTSGLRAAVATLRQLLREYGRRLPCLKIRDWPDFPRRGVMLDISRGRVPTLKTLFELVDHLADFKINEFQLYTEHTFAYRKYRAVWRDSGALTAGEIRRLDARCCELGIDLVPNQNSLGHLRHWLEQPQFRELAEVSQPYEGAHGDFLRYPSTLAPNHPATLPFLRELYDELLPNFKSEFFNVGCDEAWDLGRGQSRRICERKGKGWVYLNFLKSIHREVSVRGRRMMFWGDIILHYPSLIRGLPREVIALSWGYEAGHPFDRDLRKFSRSGVPFYVCPGTSTWMTLIGRHDNAVANLRNAARAGLRHGAIGYLITDWGDGGHPQPLAVSYLPYLAGAALSWRATTCDWESLIHVLDRDVFQDPTGCVARTAFKLGMAHRKLHYLEPNATPLGTVIAAPPAERRELFCLHGRTCYTRVSEKSIRATLAELEKQIAVLKRSRLRLKQLGPGILLRELELAARMAAQSCRFMLWQQTLAAGKILRAQRLARMGLAELRRLDRDFRAHWPRRNKGSTEKIWPFLRWRMEDYQGPILKSGLKIRRAPRARRPLG